MNRQYEQAFNRKETWMANKIYHWHSEFKIKQGTIHTYTMHTPLKSQCQFIREDV